MRVLVTGAMGLLGAAVVRRLQADGLTVLTGYDDGFRRDLRTPGEAAKLIQGEAPDVVVHCAAKIGGIAAQKADPSMPVIDNLLMGAQVIDACAKAKAKLIFISSSTVYPMSIAQGGVSNETVALTFRTAKEAWPLCPEPTYRGVGQMKVYLEDLVDFYADAFGLHAVILRPTAIYGPGDRGFYKDGHVVPDLIRRADAGEVPLTVWGSPDVVRDFVYVDDVADAVSMALHAPDRVAVWGSIFNVGGGVHTTISVLADAIMLAVHGPHRLVELEDRYGPGKHIRFAADQPTAIPWRAVSIEHIHDVLGWKPTVTLADGIRRTLSWWRAQQQAKAGHC